MDTEAEPASTYIHDLWYLLDPQLLDPQLLESAYAAASRWALENPSQFAGWSKAADHEFDSFSKTLNPTVVDDRSQNVDTAYSLTSQEMEWEPTMDNNNRILDEAMPRNSIIMDKYFAAQEAARGTPERDPPSEDMGSSPPSYSYNPNSEPTRDVTPTPRDRRPRPPSYEEAKITKPLSFPPFDTAPFYMTVIKKVPRAPCYLGINFELHSDGFMIPLAEQPLPKSNLALHKLWHSDHVDYFVRKRMVKNIPYQLGENVEPWGFVDLSKFTRTEEDGERFDLYAAGMTQFGFVQKRVQVRERVPLRGGGLHF